MFGFRCGGGLMLDCRCCEDWGEEGSKARRGVVSDVMTRGEAAATEYSRETAMGWIFAKFGSETTGCWLEQTERESSFADADNNNENVLITYGSSCLDGNPTRTNTTPPAFGPSSQHNKSRGTTLTTTALRFGVFCVPIARVSLSHASLPNAIGAAIAANPHFMLPARINIQTCTRPECLFRGTRIVGIRYGQLAS